MTLVISQERMKEMLDLWTDRWTQNLWIDIERPKSQLTAK